MFNHLDATTRLVLVRARSLAITGDVTRANELLEEAISAGAAAGNLETIALWMLKAEILHLNGDDAEALNIFRDHIEPLLAGAPAEVGIIVGFNRASVSFSLLQPNDYYSLLDQSRLAGIKLWRHEAILDVLVQRESESRGLRVSEFGAFDFALGGRG